MSDRLRPILFIILYVFALLAAFRLALVTAANPPAAVGEWLVAGFCWAMMGVMFLFIWQFWRRGRD